MRIPVDVDALARSAARAWETAASDATVATRRLATGTRVMSAVDDAAGLAIAERMRAQFEGLFQASRNAQEGVNFLAVAEGALSRTGDMLHRIRVLAVQSANGTYNDAQRAVLQGVVDRTLDEIDAVAHGTRYNGAALLDGTRTQWTLHVGADTGDTFTVTLGAATADALGLDGTLDERAAAEARFARAALDLGPLSIATQHQAVNALDIVDRALAYLLTERAEHGASLERLEAMIDSLGASAQAVDGARARITDADVPAETARLLRARIAGESSAAVMAQAQRAQALVLELLRPLASSTAPTGPVRTVAASAASAASAADGPGGAAATGAPARSSGPSSAPVAPSAPATTGSIPVATGARPAAWAPAPAAALPAPTSPRPGRAWDTPTGERTHALGAG